MQDRQARRRRSAPGPAGLAAAQQLTRAGHDVVVLERADRIGGLLRYGIPEFKMEKRHLDRRLAQMGAEGTEFRTNADVGDDVDVDVLLRVVRRRSCSPCGATAWRDLPIPGRELDGIHQAMEYLPPANRVQEGDLDALADRRRRQARRDHRRRRHRRRLPRHRAPPGRGVGHQLEILPRPPDDRAADQPVAAVAADLPRSSSAHEEGGERVYSVNTERFVDDGDGNVRGAACCTRSRWSTASSTKIEGTDRELPGRARAAGDGLRRARSRARGSSSSASSSTRAATSRATTDFMTSVPGVFVAGDMGRGQSLIVWAIAEGRSCAAGVDRYLMGETQLPAPIAPTTRPLM